MAIAAPTKKGLDVITDPVTKKQFARDPNVAGSTYQDYVPEPANVMGAEDLGKSRGVFSTYFPTPTAATGLASTAMSSRDAYLGQLATEADQITQEQEKGGNLIKEIYSKLSGSNKRKVDEYEKGGIYDQKREIDELTSQMEAEGRRFDLQIEDLEKNNPDGKLRSGIDIDRNNLSREKARTLADLGIALNAKTRNYETARAIIDQKAEAETEDLKIDLEGLKFFYNENANRLDKNEATLLQQQIREAENEYQEQRDLRKTIGNLQLTAASNGAPISVVRAIGQALDEEAAIIAAAGYAKSGNGSGSIDQYKDDEIREISRAGLSGASSRVKDMFAEAPAGFRSAYIRNGFGNKDVTPEILLRNIEEWEAANKNGGDDAVILQQVIEAARSGG